MVVGYGMVKKSDLTGSVASVNVDEMAKRNPVNIGQALQGAAAGVQVMRNGGDPSGETTIRIRGIGTVQGSADPFMSLMVLSVVLLWLILLILLLLKS